MKKVKWGILGVAKIGVEKVIPALQGGKYSSVVAIASRSPGKARAAAKKLGIPRAHGSYEDLLADPDVEAVYTPLPNHLHVPWSIRAARSGKHVLCEKPIALSAKESRSLLRARERTGVLIQEASMVRTHPQWLAAQELVRRKKLGQLRVVQGCFSYFNRDAKNVRNTVATGGGGLFDIGYYPITAARFFFEEEPKRVLGLLDRDPKFKTDRLTSAILHFSQGHAVFTCSTQLVRYQRLELLGTQGRIEMPFPFTPPNNHSCRLLLDDGSGVQGEGGETFVFDPCDQYRIQGDLFSKAIRDGTGALVPLEDAVKNMAVIDALFRSGKSGKWEKP
jgi:predicted dehydrogenase